MGWYKVYRLHRGVKRGMHWVEPSLVIRVSAMEWIEKGRLRAPVFVRLRHDKLPQECGFED